MYRLYLKKQGQLDFTPNDKAKKTLRTATILQNSVI